MTPRLKMLSVMLALSIVYSVYDYIDRNKTDKQIVKPTRKTTKRPGTARVSRTRAADLNKRLNNQKETQTKKSFHHSMTFFLCQMKLFHWKAGLEIHLWRFLSL